jgi:hypothetical protein
MPRYHYMVSNLYGEYSHQGTVLIDNNHGMPGTINGHADNLIDMIEFTQQLYRKYKTGGINEE